MHRRTFLGTLATVVVAAALPRFARPQGPPKLWGDGIHDDTAAIQWHLDHVEGFRAVGQDFLVSGTIDTTRARHAVIMDCRFHGAPGFHGPLLRTSLA